MLYKLFRILYLRTKMQIESINQERIAQEISPEGVSSIEYAYVDDGNPLHMLNLYKPKFCPNTAVLPFVIDIHGGGWICGDKDTNNNFCSHLAIGGNVVATLSYRTIDHCTLREQVQDLFAFFHWAEDQHEQYGISMERVFLAGDSAGAHLALLAYCVNQSSKLQTLFSVTPVNFCAKGLILNHSVCYLNEAANLQNRKLLSRYFLNPGLLEMLYGKNYSSMPLYLHTVVPRNYLFPKTVLPPILLITSKGDKHFSYQTIKLYNELKELGKACELYNEESPNADHVFNIAYPDSNMGSKCNQYILCFIDTWA